MADTQTLDPYAVDETQPITIMPREWFYFKAELNDQIAQDNAVDLVKALHAARFYAEIERRTEAMEAGHYIEFTAEEWEKFVNEQAV